MMPIMRKIWTYMFPRIFDSPQLSLEEHVYSLGVCRHPLFPCVNLDMVRIIISHTVNRGNRTMMENFNNKKSDAASMYNTGALFCPTIL